MTQESLRQAMHRVQDELDQAVAGFNARGAEYFQKAFFAAGLLVLAGYFVLYRPSAAQLASLRMQVRSLEEIDKFSGQYHDFKAKISDLKGRFPTEADRKDWLFNLIYNSARDQGISIQSISSQRDEDRPEMPFVKLSIQANCKGTFQQIGSWIGRLEGASRFVQIETITLSKVHEMTADPASTGMETVILTVATVIPKGSEGQ